ncbi:MAG TPA: DUF1302 domain-containing protein [Stenotrophobium sp.]|nr:DUF1302 domain-containing protein [Stenotrophobium sp.]
MHLSATRPALATVTALLMLLASSSAYAITFNLDYGDGISGVLNSTLTVGGAWRMQKRSADLIGKSNLNPDVCAGQLQSCQGVFMDQTAPAKALVAAPGSFSLNGDDGDLNYDQHDLIQGVAKVTQDIKLSYNNFTFFSRWLYFYDAVNNNFTEYHPNRIVPENFNQVGYAPGDRSFVNAGIASPIVQALYFPNNRLFGRGGVVRNRRTDGEALRQAGTNFQLLDAFVSGKFALPGNHSLTLKLGRQTVNWGESTTLVINSINQSNPVNANNLNRVGFQLEEVFTPVGMLFASTDLGHGLSVESYYQYEWEPVEIPTPGTFFSFLDIGTNNVGRSVAINFGGPAEDPYGIAKPQNNPLALIAGTSTTIERLPDHDARNSGQYGVALKYYADWLNNGTAFGLYYMNYHSKLPYASFYATQQSCAKNATNSLALLTSCTDLPLNRILLGQDPRLATSSVAPLDSAKFQLEYPENIKMLGVSFNTTVGDVSLQGELAYRPDAPLQVSLVDLAFASFGPTLTNCQDPNQHCTGSSNGSIGIDGKTHGHSDFIDGNGSNPYPDTIDAGVPTTALLGIPGLTLPGGLPSAISLGHIPGSARSFPNFIIPYRGGTLGENPATDLTRPLDRNNPGYIRGWEYFKTLQYNFGGTYVSGASDLFAAAIGASQILTVFELGATQVPGLPSLDRLQIEGPGDYTSASAGADGSGADGSRRACSTNAACTVGPDGLRFNPHQQRDGWVTSFSWGYRLINIIKYESLLPGISVQPTIVFAHDVKGTAPGPAENFVEGRKTIVTSVETRYKSALSFTLGYTWYTGGGEHNLLRDRDYSQAYVKYQF